jgi:hypothetical protein
MSNSKEILKRIPKEEQAKTLIIDDKESMTMKTLGLRWSADEDQFHFAVKKFSGDRITKRSLLGWIARIFDPLGILSTYVIRGKIFLQEIWMCGADWDSELPLHIEEKVNKWLEEADQIEEIKLPRCLLQSGKSDWSLHVFSDASSEAFGAVVYVREEIEGTVNVRFVASKAKVAPLKTISIPRLELMGACLGVKLVKKVVEAMNFDIAAVTFWTDSMDVLYWVRQRSRLFKPFIANRVGELQELTKGNQKS